MNGSPADKYCSKENDIQMLMRLIFKCLHINNHVPHISRGGRHTLSLNGQPQTMVLERRVPEPCT
jgi:hypothetical protein